MPDEGDTYRQSGDLGIGHMSGGEIKEGAKVAGVINEAEQQFQGDKNAVIQKIDSANTVYICTAILIMRMVINTFSVKLTDGT